MLSVAIERMIGRLGHGVGPVCPFAAIRPNRCRRRLRLRAACWLPSTRAQLRRRRMPRASAHLPKIADK
jgi:hypothetical protein